MIFSHFPVSFSDKCFNPFVPMPYRISEFYSHFHFIIISSSFLTHKCFHFPFQFFCEFQYLCRFRKIASCQFHFMKIASCRFHFMKIASRRFHFMKIASCRFHFMKIASCRFHFMKIASCRYRVFALWRAAARSTFFFSKFLFSLFSTLKKSYRMYTGTLLEK